MRAAAQRGIPVSGTRYSPSDTAELTWGLILTLARDLPAEIAAVRDRRWQERFGTVLAGTTLGMLGLGNLGRRVARIGAAFEMDVIAWSENLTAEAAAAAGASLVSKNELFSRSDVLSVHLRRFPDLVLTPHIGYVTRENYRIFLADAVDDIAAFAAGSPIRLVEPH